MQKSLEKIWWSQKKVVPLQHKIKNNPKLVTKNFTIMTRNEIKVTVLEQYKRNGVTVQLVETNMPNKYSHFIYYKKGLVGMEHYETYELAKALFDYKKA